MRGNVLSMNTTTKFQIESVKIERIADRDADTSYLEQEGFEDRLAEYRNESFGFIGIQAKAVVSYPMDEQGNRRLETLTSGGLWGIEGDSSREHLAEIEAEELAALAQHLAAFGIEATKEELASLAE